MEQKTKILRPEQMQCVEKACSAFNNGSDVFLISAKPRFGKTVSVFEIIKRMGWKKVLVMTHVTDVKKQWNEEAFAYNMKFGDKFIPFSNEFVVFYSNQQSATDYLLGKNDSTLSNIVFDCLIVDEAHTSKASFSSDRINEIKRNNTIYLTGTSIDFFRRKEFKEDLCYWFDYFSEQIEKEKEMKENNDRNRGHKINAIIIDIEGHERGKFDDISYCNAFVSILDTHGVLGESSVRSFYKPNRLLFRMDNIKHCDNIEKVIKDKYGDKYTIVKAYGDRWWKVEGQKESSIKKGDTEDINCVMDRSPKVIVLSCQSLCTGVTLRNLDSVLYISDEISYEKTIQTMFRCQTYNSDRYNFELNNDGIGGGNVFFFSKKQAVMSLVSMCDSMLITNRYLSDITKNVVKYVNVVGIDETNGTSNISDINLRSMLWQFRKEFDKSIKYEIDILDHNEKCDSKNRQENNQVIEGVACPIENNSIAEGIQLIEDVLDQVVHDLTVEKCELEQDNSPCDTLRSITVCDSVLDIPNCEIIIENNIDTIPCDIATIVDEWSSKTVPSSWGFLQRKPRRPSFKYTYPDYEKFIKSFERTEVAV